MMVFQWWKPFITKNTIHFIKFFIEKIGAIVKNPRHVCFDKLSYLSQNSGLIYVHHKLIQSFYIPYDKIHIGVMLRYTSLENNHP